MIEGCVADSYCDIRTGNELSAKMCQLWKDLECTTSGNWMIAEWCRWPPQQRCMIEQAEEVIAGMRSVLAMMERDELAYQSAFARE